jgi:soluble lytic murein transglycosylase-like protein
MYTRMRLAGFLFLAAWAAQAGEYAVLTSGGRLHADRHEVDGGKVRLYTAGGGSIEMEASGIAAFEPDGRIVAAPAPAAPVAAALVETARPVDPRKLIDEAADRYALPRKLVHSLVKAESGYRAGAVSSKGAIGLMQLMPGTAKLLGADPHDPAQNVDAGTRHLRDLLLKYDGGLYRALAAYNAGAGAVAKYHGVPPYAETLGYIRRIVRDSGLSE